MHLFEAPQNENVDLTGIESPYFLLGLLSAFDNRFQAAADRLIGEISWKQFFTVICINMCRESPTLRQLAEIMGTSHQNCKQLLLKLEAKGFVRLETDPTDKRKQRICLTEACLRFCRENDSRSQQLMEQMFRGIPQEDILTTIRTIMQMEKQLSGLMPAKHKEETSR